MEWQLFGSETDGKTWTLLTKTAADGSNPTPLARKTCITDQTLETSKPPPPPAREEHEFRQDEKCLARQFPHGRFRRTFLKQLV